MVAQPFTRSLSPAVSLLAMHPHSKGRCCSRATPSSSQAAHQADRTPGGNTSEPMQGTQAASRQRVEHQRPHHQEAQRRSAEKRREPKRSAEKLRVAVAASHVRRQAAPACSPPALLLSALPCLAREGRHCTRPGGQLIWPRGGKGRRSRHGGAGNISRAAICASETG